VETWSRLYLHASDLHRLVGKVFQPRQQLYVYLHAAVSSREELDGFDIEDKRQDPARFDRNVRDGFHRYLRRQRKCQVSEHRLRNKYPRIDLAANTLDAMDRRESQAARMHRNRGGMKNPLGKDGKMTRCNACGSDEHWFAHCPAPNRGDLACERRRKLQRAIHKSPSPSVYFAMASFLLQQEGPEPVEDADAVEAALGNMAIDSDMEANGTEDSRQDRPKVGAESHFGDIEEDWESYRASDDRHQVLRDEHELLGAEGDAAEPYFGIRRRY
jgi:hypothetical protein